MEAYIKISPKTRQIRKEKNGKRGVRPRICRLLYISTGIHEFDVEVVHAVNFVMNSIPKKGLYGYLLIDYDIYMSGEDFKAYIQCRLPTKSGSINCRIPIKYRSSDGFIEIIEN